MSQIEMFSRRPRSAYRNRWAERKAKRRAEAEARQLEYDADVDRTVDAIKNTDSLAGYLSTLSTSQVLRQWTRLTST